jgi:hypothetical protein
MAYDLAIYKQYLMHWKRPKLTKNNIKRRIVLFGLSRAIGYVKYGHHSFFEALIPLKGNYISNKHYESPENLWFYAELSG